MLRPAAIGICLLASPAVLTAQIIGIKTVPIAAGDQFRLFPTQRAGMADVGLALRDRDGDPFRNPALGMRINEPRLYGSPTLYRISGDNGGARSLPLALLVGNGDWFGGGAAALQQMDTPDQFAGWLVRDVPGVRPSSITQPELLSDRAATNLYAFGFLGHRLSGGNVALGVSAFYADLNAMDGVNLLYASAQDIDQAGHVAQIQLGTVVDFAGSRSLEVVGAYQGVRMRHDVRYVDWIVTDSTLWIVEPRDRTEINLDHTDSWGLRLGYDQPLGERWHLGGAVTANVKSHPKLPNYDLMNIPRDPGTSWAYNVGVGVAWTGGPTTFAVDLVYEPIRSHTWAEAALPIARPNGGVMPAGAVTIDNRFTFSNAMLRMGLAQEVDRTTVQFGLQLYAINYDLVQRDFVQAQSRRQREQWMEWTPTWGLTVRFDELELRYAGRLTTGGGRPGVAWSGTARAAMEPAVEADILLAPSGPLTLQDARVTSHQFSVSVPIR